MDPLDALNVFDIATSPTSSKAAARAARRAAKALKNTPSSSERLLPKTENQKIYFDMLRRGCSIFSVGPAGTGKTYAAARFGARKIVENQIDKLIVARVTVSDPRHALGFLPGKLDQKLGPWIVPVLDAVKAEVGGQVLDKWKQEGKFEMASFEHMRGRTFRDCVVVLDEAQNATYTDLKLLLTRIGENCQVIITGDLDQIDINNSGLAKIMMLARVYEVPMEVIEFTEDDVVRSEFTKAWVKAFKAEENQANQPIRSPSVPRRRQINPVIVENLDQLPAFLQNGRTVTKLT